MADKICIDLSRKFKMEHADAIAGALDFHQKFAMEELGKDVGMKTIIFEENPDGTITVCGEKQDIVDFSKFVSTLKEQSKWLITALNNKILENFPDKL